MLRISLILALIFPTLCSAQIYLLTYPRSGNHLFYFSLSHILNIPAVVLNDKSDAFLMIKPYQIDPTQNWYLEPIKQMPNNVLLMSHFPKSLELTHADQFKDYLIVIVRNYHECLPRQAYMNAKSYEKIDLEPIFVQYSHRNALPQQTCFNFNNNFDYIVPLECYEQWNEKTRHLIYYEDLITNFEETMQGCLDKLHITEHHFREFMDHYDEMMLMCKNLYRNHQRGTLSEGDLHYHQNHLMTRKTAKKFDALFRDNFPDLWEKYLKHYETQ